MSDHILGYTWQQIQTAQQGGKLSAGRIDTSKPINNSLMDGDMALFEKHGEAGLRELGFYGVIDRLQHNGIIALPKFPETQCSQCGKSFGAGDHGFSECVNHAHLIGTV